MKFKEPLKVDCEHCGYEFEEMLLWVRTKGQLCPKCGKILNEVRERVENRINSWRCFVAVISIVIELEDRFSITFTDSEIEKVFTENNLEKNLSSVSDFTKLTTEVLLREKHSTGLAKIETEIIQIISGLIKVDSYRIKLETKILDLLEFSVD
jgi:DNA-directed RNA polymerase subunit RPC12/RpoP